MNPSIKYWELLTCFDPESRTAENFSRLAVTMGTTGVFRFRESVRRVLVNYLQCHLQMKIVSLFIIIISFHLLFLIFSIIFSPLVLYLKLIFVKRKKILKFKKKNVFKAFLFVTFQVISSFSLLNWLFTMSFTDENSILFIIIKSFFLFFFKDFQTFML